jgi:hypothetical protein
VLGFVDGATVLDHGWGATFLDEKTGVYLGACAAWTEEERLAATRELRVSTGELELRAIVHWLSVFGQRCKNQRVLLLCDNMAACQGLQKCFSPKPGLLGVIRAIRSLCCDLNVVVRVAKVSTKMNTVADQLSHMQIESAQCHAEEIFGKRFRLLRSAQSGQRLTRA